MSLRDMAPGCWRINEDVILNVVKDLDFYNDYDKPQVPFGFAQGRLSATRFALRSG